MPRRASHRSWDPHRSTNRFDLRIVALLVGSVALALTMAPAGAQQGGSNAEPGLDVTVEARVDAPRRNVVAVMVDGLDGFADGTLAIYQCGNADSSGSPIDPTEDDCFAPDDDGYRAIAIGEDASVTVRYQLVRRAIGANGARCIPSLDGGGSCQLVVGAVHGSDAEIVGVSLDDALADLDDAATSAQPASPDAVGDEPMTTLPVTGLGPRGVAIALFIAAGCLYLGSLLRSSTQPI